MKTDGRLDEHPSAIARVLGWWSSTRERWARLAELQELSSDELGRVAADFGVSPAELLEVSSRHDYTPELLERRLAALNLDPEEIRLLSPLLLRDLQRTCATCAERQRCKDDMNESPLAAGWESYCPNSGTLRTLT